MAAGKVEVVEPSEEEEDTVVGLAEATDVLDVEADTEEAAETMRETKMAT